jgi:membrane peptidoglycan carboxypeptidase
LFEPGSTIKPLVSLLAIEKNMYDEKELFDCRPMQITYNNVNRTISDSHELGRISFRDIIVQSSNVGIAKIAERLGKEAVYRHYLNFGIGTTTNVDLLDESSGRFSKVSDWSGFTLHSVAFGHEMSVTALQLANVYCALANGGKLLKPNIISKKIDNNGRVYYESERKVMKNLSNRKAFELNNSMLLDVVESGTGSNTRFQNIKIAGKTGTSEKIINGTYSKQHNIASFAGFFPYEAPEYVIVIIYDEPEFRYRYGSSSAVPTFKNIVEEMLTLPDCNIITELKMNNQEMVTMPRLTGLKVKDAKKALNNLKVEFQMFNETENSYVVQQFPQPGVQFTLRNKATLYCSLEREPVERQDEITEMIMPNLVGLTLRQAINMSKTLKLNLIIEGSGYIVSQSVKAGQRVDYQQRCVVVAR